MIDFQRITLEQKQKYEAILFSCPERGSGYSFANLFLWGCQQVAFVHDCVVFFSHFNGRSLYPYPIGNGDHRAAIEEILNDARQRGIPCRIAGMLQEDWEQLDSWFPGRFLVRSDRDSFDYVYDIHDLKALKGRKFQKKRNHINRFLSLYPDWQVQPLTQENMEAAQTMAEDWYVSRAETDPHGDYLLEKIAMDRAFRSFEALGMEGMVLTVDDQIAAITMASRLSGRTMDIHFEKAREDIEGAYPMINRSFANYLYSRYPEIEFLNREDDMGLPGLRKAKLDYQPHHMSEKYWACLPEDIHGMV